MRWYLNDLSIRGQFADRLEFEREMAELGKLRSQFTTLRQQFYVTATFSSRLIDHELDVRDALRRSSNRDLRSLILTWLTRTGPFVDEDRLVDQDDYFECFGQTATDSGVGEAARRVKAGEDATCYSFPGGPAPSFQQDPLTVEHGLAEERLGRYLVPNLWSSEDLIKSAMRHGPPVNSWQRLIEAARERYPRLLIPDSVYTDSRLAAQPFDGIIRDRSFALLSVLNEYMAARNSDGSETVAATEIVRDFFQGQRSLFSPESETNRKTFGQTLLFLDPEDPRRTLDGHWHGKISHLVFRLHFEWPVAAQDRRLKILYLGPKLTKK